MIPKLFNEFPIMDIYHDYLDEKNDENYEDRYEGNEKYFGASGAGGCYFKHLLSTKYKQDTPKTPGGVITYAGMRKMRLGTILHKDIQAAVKRYKIKHQSELDAKKFEILMEEEVMVDKLNVRGFFDLAIVDHNNKRVLVADIKTVHSYKWSLMFGRNRAPLRDANDSKTYELQLATYLIWFMQKYPAYEHEMGFLYYKKDDSSIKIKENPSGYVSDAVNYWLGVNEFCQEETEKTIIHGITANTPMAEWECNYCGYASHCKSQLIKKRN